ncbi:hypothetical protein [Microtetraspora malaysiensis]|uniref:hypothetical protein n=1 Tax=Microtetraspora malaysiensis TaxID=161358 RepID=UPI003D912696
MTLGTMPCGAPTGLPLVVMNVCYAPPPPPLLLWGPLLAVVTVAYHRRRRADRAWVTC